MLKVSIKGMKDGLHEFEAQTDATSIDGMFPEFIGEVLVQGDVRKIGMRFIIEAHAECLAEMVCDVSGETFQQLIETELTTPYVADTSLFQLHRDDVDPEPPYYIHEDASTIDITNEVREELAVHIPMKRVAPQHRDKDLHKLYPELTDDDSDARADADGEEIFDKRWEALKNIKFSDN